MAYVIIADDDEIMTDVLREVFESYGHTVGSVANGEEALNAVWSTKPDALVLDCNMPERSGLMTLREIRQSKQFYALPVILVTGRRGDQDVTLGMREGANDYVKKPFDPHQLVFRVEALLNREADEQKA